MILTADEARHLSVMLAQDLRSGSEYNHDKWLPLWGKLQELCEWEGVSATP